jgi:hypothetical protein
MAAAFPDQVIIWSGEFIPTTIRWGTNTGAAFQVQITRSYAMILHVGVIPVQTPIQ